MLKTTGLWYEDGKVIERKTQDVEPVLEQNKALLNDGTGGWSKSRDLRRVASIPMAVVEQWMREGVDIFDPNCREAVQRRLNDPQYAFLRTAPGRL